MPVKKRLETYWSHHIDMNKMSQAAQIWFISFSPNMPHHIVLKKPHLRREIICIYKEISFITLKTSRILDTPVYKPTFWLYDRVCKFMADRLLVLRRVQAQSFLLSLSLCLCLSPYSHNPHLYIYILFGLVLWHINHSRLFNAKSIFVHINSSVLNN